MFTVHLNDGSQEIPADDICYIVAKEGIFLKKKLGVMESIAPVKNISFLESVATMARMNINKIPAMSAAKVISFFREVYQTYYGEAIVLLFYNEQTGRYRIVPPKQKVTSGSLDYDRLITIEGYTMIGTIHSHAGMSAFHSGIDDDDEKTFDGLHITFGNMRDEEISVSASIIANGYRFMVEPEDYIAGIVKTKDVDETVKSYTNKIYRMVNGKMELDEKASARTAYSYKKMDKRYVTTVPESKGRHNANWMKMVEKGTYAYAYGYAGVGRLPRWAAGQTGNYWGEHFDADAWNKYHKIGSKPPAGVASPPAQKQLPLNTPTGCSGKDAAVACLTCKHLHDKIDLEEEGYLEDEFYMCKQCGMIVGGDSEEIECPTCKTSDHLEVLDTSELPDNYQVRTPTPLVKPVGATHKCEHCSATFSLFPGDEVCPFCYALLPGASTEATLEHQARVDSGATLDGDADAANEEGLRQAAAEEDKIPLTDPAQSSSPLPAEGLIKKLMSKAFKGKGGNA